MRCLQNAEFVSRLSGLAKWPMPLQYQLLAFGGPELSPGLYTDCVSAWSMKSVAADVAFEIICLSAVM